MRSYKETELYKEKLQTHINSLSTLIFIEYFDFNFIDSIIATIAKEGGQKVYEFHEALGQVDFDTKAPLNSSLPCKSIEEFLLSVREDGYDNEIFIVLKDIYEDLKNPRVVSLLRRIAEDNQNREGYYASVFVISAHLHFPKEIEPFINIFNISPPSLSDIRNIIQDFSLNRDVNVEDIDELALSLKGLNHFQIDRILTLAYCAGGSIDSNDKKLILREKEQFIKKTGMLEIISIEESIDDIGGLENLKKWLEQKAKIVKNLDKALKYGVEIPKGVMIVGMPGCGKSLAAKACARLFDVPLIRLDVGRLLGKYIGESEENMQKALKLTEAINPCVLWIDEIEKAFAGIGSGQGHEVTTRLFGQFLTWMQEKKDSVFVVATANNLAGMPPEFLRKGRFDEVFFVDFPSFNERKEILKLHLKKRNKYHLNIDLLQLAKNTEGFNGADLESVVKDCIEEAFITSKDSLQTDDLLKKINDTKPISKTLKEKIKKLKEDIKEMDIKNASTNC